MEFTEAKGMGDVTVLLVGRFGGGYPRLKKAASRKYFFPARRRKNRNFRPQESRAETRRVY